VAAWVKKRTRSAVSITARRGSRSAQTPPTTMNDARPRVKAASTIPSPVAPPPIRRTAKASATGISASPIEEPVRPSQSSRNGRSVSGPKRPRPRTLAA